VEFSVNADGSLPLSYQWFFNDTNVITGAINSILHLANNVQLSQAGTYTVVVSNAFGAVTSSPALLTVKYTETSLRAAMAGGGTITIPCDAAITLTDTIIVTTSTVLDGTGHAVTISGGNTVRVFYVNPGVNFSAVNLTIANGRSPNGPNGTETSMNGGPGEPGGGIYNSGTLILRDCVVTANRTGNGGYGNSLPYSSYHDGGAGGAGGGIYNSGNLTLSNCLVSGNSTGSGGGGGGGPTYYPAGGDGGSGGGIYNAGSLQLYNSTISGNNAGNGPDNPMRGPGANGGAGGGIWSAGNLTANSCTFSFNSAGNGGGGGRSDMSGGSGGDGGLGGAICSTGSLALTNCTFGGNSAGQGGAGGSGGLPPFGSAGPAGHAGTGAGIYNQNNLVLVNCSITANRIGGGVTNASGTARLLNTIVALNSGNPPDVSGMFLSLGHNLIGATDGSSGFPMSGDLVGSSAFPLDPKLGPLTNNGGPTLTMALLPGSPAIDAGDNASAPPTDQRGVVRPYGVACDIGAYEWSPPSMTIPPPTQTAEIGTTIEFAAQASTFPSTTYQWFFNGNAITGCTNCVLCLSGVQATNVGAYTLVVSNVDGVKTSSPAMLNVVPVVERRPVPAVKVAGKAGSLLNVDYANSLNPSSNWTTLGSVTLTSTSQICPDLTMPLPAARFYRAWQTGTPGMAATLNLNFVPAITLTGNVGDSLRLDYINAIGPTNAWVTLDTVTLTNTSQLYFDVTAPGQPQRLYRIMPNP
jgi:hypothetical protein